MAASTRGRMALVAAILSSSALLLQLKRAKKRKRVRSVLARPETTNTETKTVVHNLKEELRLEDHSHEDFLGMSKDDFRELLELVAPYIAKADTNMRKAVSPDQRLAVTLRYLVSGESRRSLASHFQISHNLISKIIPSVCRAIYQVLEPLYLKVPNTEQEWQNIANQFLIQQNFPHCIGVIDGKRVITAKPPLAVSEHRDNFIMFVLVDANYKFIFVEVGSFDTLISDSELWDKCSLQEALEADMLNIPEPALLPTSSTQCPYVMLADDAFPLKPNIMKPYPDQALSVDGKIFNNRLSCARMVSEYAFEILFHKFSIFSQPICISSENVQDVILCTVVLHNYLCTKTGNGVELADWNDSLKNTPYPALETLSVCEKTSSSDAEAVRDKLRDFFVNEGLLS